jgi:RNA polymerase sigma factor (sigma-70 family)
MDAERLFLDNLALIDRIVTATCRRHRMTREETEDFASSLKIKLIADDYAVLRVYEGRCSLAGYLTAVVQRALMDHRNHLWGRWRPSAEAKRLGPVAVRLDTLLHRDGLTLEEACAKSAPEDREEMERLAARLPHRVRRRVAGEEELVEAVDPDRSPEDELLEREREGARSGIERALAGVLAELGDEDRLLLQVRLQEGVSVVSLARALGQDVKQLYRRWETLLRRLRKSLEQCGYDAGQVSWALESRTGSGSEFGPAGPSQQVGPR